LQEQLRNKYPVLKKLEGRSDLNGNTKKSYKKARNDLNLTDPRLRNGVLFV
jgi:hypothetical protein